MKKITKKQVIGATKVVVGIAASIGSSVIVSRIVKSTCSAPMHPILRVCVVVGSFAIGGALAGVAVKSVERDIDNVVDLVSEFKTKFTEEVNKKS